METKVEDPKFRLKSVAEFLDGKHHFEIPSYQRGYRWDIKQVEDLLKDIWDFAKNDQINKSDFYCLQPVVVKQNSENNSWVVIDGQQRLTTLLLLLNFIKNGSRTPFVTNSIIYTITYLTRKNLNFNEPIKELDIDSFHVYQAKSFIENWFKDKIDEIDYSALEKVLFNKSIEIPQVKFIWYVVENDNDIDSIKIFNNMNKGKIRLTNAELIKALFILKARKEPNLKLNELSFEWNAIENALHDDKLWYFLANREYKPATRIDLIFDFLTGKKDKDDNDFSYRKFQNLYDNTNDKFWEEKNITNFNQAWSKVKDVFQTFEYWFEDNTLYHYIGYLVYWDISLKDIFTVCNGKSKKRIRESIIKLIQDRVLDFKKIDVDDFSFSDPSEKVKIKKLLLFLNIETCVNQLIDQSKEIKVFQSRDSASSYKFQFDLFKLNDWDIEHVCSRTDNPLKEIKDKIIWLSYIENITCSYSKWEDFKKESAELKKVFEEKKKDEDNKFEVLYKKILEVVQNDNIQNEEKSINKDTIENLALLDAGTNRGYGNALFPTKRKIIIEKDKGGTFVPVCTKNLFLKYYTTDDTKSSQWKNSWTDEDRKSYLTSIHEIIDFILK